MSADARAVELTRAAAVAARDKLAQDAWRSMCPSSSRSPTCSCSARPAITGAVQDVIEERMLELGAKLVRREGECEGRWVLLCFSDIVVTSSSARSASTTPWSGCGATAQ